MATNLSNLEAIASTGSPGCSCVNATAALASLPDRSCVIPASGAPGILLKLGGACVPLSYGSSRCLQHDWYDQACRVEGPSAAVPPTYCIRPWCYVDFETCARDSEERVYRSGYFGVDSGVDLFYSYSTCNSTADDWLEVEDDVVWGTGLNGASIRANVPTYFLPWMFKRNTTTQNAIVTPGGEYYDNERPFDGILIKYIDRILEASGEALGEIKYMYRSKASSRVHPTSSFNAAVQDLEDGLVDMSVGNFWITAERLKKVAFTVPLFYDQTVLMIKTPEINESFSQQARKVFSPFTPALWLLVVASIVISSLLGVWFSYVSLNSEVNVRVANDEREGGRRRRRSKAYLRLAIDGCLEKGLFFCSGGVEQDGMASLPHKCLMFGFGFIILTCVTAYVATLAASMTWQSLGRAVTTMEGAMSNGWKICAHPVLRGELERTWPGAHFVFDDSGTEYFGVLDLFERGKCKALAMAREAGVLVMDPKFRERLCELDLVYTSSVIIEIPVAFPCKAQLAPTFSHLMVRSERVNGISFQTVVDDYADRSRTTTGGMDTCEVELQVERYNHDDSVNVSQMAIPFIFFMIFAIIATILQLVSVQEQNTQPERKSSLRNFLGRVSSLEFTRRLSYVRDFTRPGDIDSLPVIQEESRDVPGCISSDSLSVLQQESQAGPQEGVPPRATAAAARGAGGDVPGCNRRTVSPRH